ncbi:predicted protein, partial [Nematostella vectensis]
VCMCQMYKAQLCVCAFVKCIRLSCACVHVSNMLRVHKNVLITFCFLCVCACVKCVRLIWACVHLCVCACSAGRVCMCQMCKAQLCVCACVKCIRLSWACVHVSNV